MKKKQTAQLEKKLTAYTLAGAAALAATGLAKADIVYVPNVNVTVTNPGSFTFLGADGITLTADVNVSNEVTASAGTGAAVLLGPSVFGDSDVAALALGAFIDPTDPTNWAQSGKLVSSFSGDQGYWPTAGGTAYMGFYFGTPGSPQAGWAKIATVANDTTSSFELLSYAYETDANTKIKAGDTGITATPEPSAIPLLVLGGVGLIALRRRRAAHA